MGPLRLHFNALYKHPDHLEPTPIQTSKQSASTDTSEYTPRSSTPRAIQAPSTNQHASTNFTLTTISHYHHAPNAILLSFIFTPRHQPSTPHLQTSRIFTSSLPPTYALQLSPLLANKQPFLDTFINLCFPYFHSLYTLFQPFTPFHVTPIIPTLTLHHTIAFYIQQPSHSTLYSILHFTNQLTHTQHYLHYTISTFTHTPF